MFTKIPYFYRDAANYSKCADIVLEGELSPTDIALISSRLDSGEFFIPGDLAGLGLEELQRRMDDYPSVDDHVFHVLALDELETSETRPEGEFSMTAKAFVDAFAARPAFMVWDVSGAMDRLGLD